MERPSRLITKKDLILETESNELKAKEPSAFRKSQIKKGRVFSYPGGSGSGRSHDVLFSTWSTKYSRPFWSTLCSHLVETTAIKNCYGHWVMVPRAVMDIALTNMSHQTTERQKRNRRWRSWCRHNEDTPQKGVLEGIATKRETKGQRRWPRNHLMLSHTCVAFYRWHVTLSSS